MTEHTLGELMAEAKALASATPEPTTDEKIDQIYRWLDELMPTARAAAKMLNARNKLVQRWRGNG